MDAFELEQPIRHKKLGIVGIVKSEVVIVTHIGRSEKKQVNVRLMDGDETFDLWWDAALVEPATAGIPFDPPMPETPALAPELALV